jgi:hypothetical protein
MRAAWAALHKPDGPGDSELLSDVGEIISAHSARETTAQDEGGSIKIRKKEERRRSKSKQSRACAMAPPPAVGRVVCVCGPKGPVVVAR